MFAKAALVTCKSLLLIVLIVFNTSCSNLKNTEINKLLNFSWSMLPIKVCNNPLSLSDRPYVYCSGKNEYYVNYNNYTNSLNFYSIDNKEFERKVQFFNSGSNKVQGVAEYAVWSDIITLKTTSGIKIIDFSGQVLEDVDLMKNCTELEDSYCFKGPGGIKMTNMRRTLHVHNNEKSIVVRTYNKENGYENIYKNPVFVGFNIETLQATSFFVEFPKELNNQYYGDLECPNIISKGDSIIYNFPFKAAIYVYDKTTATTSIKEFNAKHIPTLVKGVDLNQKRNMKLSHEFFFGYKYHQIDYDPYRNLYYMLYSQARVDNEPVQRHLIVFNKSIEKLREIDLPTDFSPNFVISKQGLLFRNLKDDSFDTLTLQVLNVVVEQQ